MAGVFERTREAGGSISWEGVDSGHLGDTLFGAFSVQHYVHKDVIGLNISLRKS
jgi:hypothetical protein